MKSMVEVEILYLRAVVGYGMTAYKRNKYIVGKLEMTLIKQQ
jgi:hypothetical protein